MQVLTMYQPHATLSALGAKTVETRAMDTKHRGWTAIHAAKNTPGDVADMALIDPFKRVLDTMVPGYAGIDSLPQGAIIGVYWLAAVTDAVKAAYGWEQTDCHYLGGMTAARNLVPLYETAFGDYSTGRKAWWTTMIYQLPEPIPCRGMPGLWDTRLLHQELLLKWGDVDPTEKRIREQMLKEYSIDISKHAMDNAEWLSLVNNRGTLDYPNTVRRVPSSHAETPLVSQAPREGPARQPAGDE